MLNHDERREVHELLSSSLPIDTSPGHASITAFLDGMAIARAEGKSWPDNLVDELVQAHIYKRQKEIAKARSIVFVDYQGRKHSKASRVGTWKKTDDGKRYQTQELLTVMTWEQVWKWEQAIATQIKSLEPNKATAAKLHELHEKYPDTGTVEEALQLVGMTLQEWLDAA